MNRIAKLLCFACVLLAMVIIPIGCHTMEGAGKDIEKAGEEIQDAAR